MATTIFIAGHGGLVGSALVRRYARDSAWTPIVRTRAELDLRDDRAVAEFFQNERPRAVILAAGRVGGIWANSTQPVDFMLDNLRIQNNVLSSAHAVGVDKLLFLGSSCIYPKHAPQPISEDALLTGPLEPTNEAYALAKIAGIKLAQAYRRQHGCRYICAMPTNLYGPHDHFTPMTSHVLPALIRKFHEAKENRDSSVVLWGTGTPRREFLHVDDLADACHFLMQHYDDEAIINVGCGVDLSIRELAERIATIVGYSGRIEWDATMPDGTPRKLLDTSRMQKLGWRPQITLEAGITSTYAWFLRNRQG